MHNQHFPLSTLQEKHNTNSTFPVFSQTISYCVFFIIPEYFTDIFLLCSFKDTGMLFKNIFYIKYPQKRILNFVAKKN